MVTCWSCDHAGENCVILFSTSLPIEIEIARCKSIERNVSVLLVATYFLQCLNEAQVQCLFKSSSLILWLEYVYCSFVLRFFWYLIYVLCFSHKQGLYEVPRCMCFLPYVSDSWNWKLTTFLNPPCSSEFYLVVRSETMKVNDLVFRRAAVTFWVRTLWLNLYY